MKNRILLLTLILTIVCLSATAVAAQDNEIVQLVVTEPTDIDPMVEKAPDVDLLDAINEGDKNGEVGLAYIGYATTIGAYKKCSTDAYFYFILVNQSNEAAAVTLPRRTKIGGQIFMVNAADYRCKALPATWKGENFSDADQGAVCELHNNQLTLPAGSAIAVRGKTVNLSHELTKGNKIAADQESLEIRFDLQIAGGRKTAIGSLTSQGSLCDVLNFLEVTPYNYVDGGYFINGNGANSCSMNYFFVVENPDPYYSTVVELPRWVELNGIRWDVGCKYLYPGCRVSGFRHYAWAILEDKDTFRGPKYHFCDQDRSFGDHCYEQKSLWWLRVPPQTRMAVRGMVNNLCNVQQENPLNEAMLEIGFNISDAGSNKWWVDGVVQGTERKIVSGKDVDLFEEYSRIEDRDADEPIERYLFEDSSLSVQ